MSGAPGPKVPRHLAATFAADVEGYSRLMGIDEVQTLQTLMGHREIMDRLIGEHGGRIANTAGDSVLAEFPSAVDAVQAAVDVQEALGTANEALAEDHQVRFRIGVHVGDVMVKGGDLFGDGVNIAARLQAIAEPGGVSISAAAHEYVRKTLPLTYNDLGPHQVKNTAELVKAYSVATGHGASTPRTSKPLPVPDKPSIAVLPFTNLSGDPDQEYFADGMVEDIITALSRVRWFFVIARHSSFVYKGRAVDVRQVGRDLGVRYVLEGSIRKAGSRIRVTGQLIEAATAHHVWAERFDGSLEDIFDLQDRITESVVAAIEPNLRLAEVERARAKPTNSLDAYDLYLQALPHHYSLTRAGLSHALELLRHALRLDPNYAFAKAYAAFTITTLKGQGWAEESDIKEGARLAREALADSRDDPTVLALAGMAVAYLDRDFDGACAALDRAMTLNPISALVVSRSAYVRSYIGDIHTAIEHFQRAMRLSPLDPDSHFYLTAISYCYVLAGQFDLALAHSERATRERPTFAAAWRILAVSYAYLGRFADAHVALERMLELAPDFTIRQVRSGMFYRDPTVAERYLEGLRLAGLPE